VPVSFYVTTIAFVCYLAARFGGPAAERLRGLGPTSPPPAA
jgi:hypothetical protein